MVHHDSSRLIIIPAGMDWSAARRKLATKLVVFLKQPVRQKSAAVACR
jgi:hypothetical protein